MVRRVTWRATVGLRSVRIYFVVCGVVAALCSIQPIFAVMGPELALVLGLVLPLFAAGTSARILVAARAGSDLRSPRELVARSVGVSLVGLAIPLLAAALSGLARGFCDPWQGLLFMLLGPVVGVPLAALAGLVAATLTERPRIGTVLAALVPLGSIAVGLWRFVDTPAIFAYATFVGYFPGSLYDPEISIEAPYWTLRLTNVVLAVALGLALEAGFDGRRLVVRRLASGRGGLAVALGIALVIGEAYGPGLGHRSTAAPIPARPGGRPRGERRTVVGPPGSGRPMARSWDIAGRGPRSPPGSEGASTGSGAP